MTTYCTKDHEWISVDGPMGTVGIPDYAQEQRGDITFVELPGEGDSVSKGDSVSVVDSVKAASDVYTPVSGEVREANGALADEPELVNTKPESDGWLFKVLLSDASELEGLMDEPAYKAYVDSL